MILWVDFGSRGRLHATAFRPSARVIGADSAVENLLRWPKYAESLKQRVYKRNREVVWVDSMHSISSFRDSFRASQIHDDQS